MARRRLALHAATDVGRLRTENEDSHAVWIPEGDRELRSRGALLVVADGMGGAVAGEVASRLAVETVVRCHREWRSTRGAVELRRAIEDANRQVLAKSRTDQAFKGMGTTCTAVVVREREIVVAHVGDSRAYLIRNGQIRQLTQDHSLVAQLVQRQELTPEHARRDPRRNVMTRSVGVGEQLEVDTMVLEPGLEPGDTLLLCSDGLHGQVSDTELADWGGDEDQESACQQLIKLANDSGGPDNITVVVARLEGRVTGGGPRDEQEWRKALILQSLLVFLLASLTVTGALWWVYHAVSG